MDTAGSDPLAGPWGALQSGTLLKTTGECRDREAIGSQQREAVDPSAMRLGGRHIGEGDIQPAQIKEHGSSRLLGPVDAQRRTRRYLA